MCHTAFRVNVKQSKIYLSGSLVEFLFSYHLQYYYYHYYNIMSWFIQVVVGIVMGKVVSTGASITPTTKQLAADSKSVYQILMGALVHLVIKG